VLLSRGSIAATFGNRDRGAHQFASTTLPFRVDDRLLLIERVPLPRHMPPVAQHEMGCSVEPVAGITVQQRAQARNDAAATSEAFRVNGLTLPSVRDRSPRAPSIERRNINDPTATTQHQTSVPRRLVCSLRGVVAATATFARAKAQMPSPLTAVKAAADIGGSSAVF
jgi:hypothetical protein